MIDKGTAVVVVKGRKVAKGTKGIVRWIGSNHFGTSVGLAVEGSDKLVFTAISNVEADESPEAKAAEIEAAHDSALWFEAKRVEREAGLAEAVKVLPSVGVQKGDKVTPKSGVYAGRACRVIWVGAKPEGVKVGVVPVARPVWSRYTRRMEFPRFNADWLPVAEVQGEC
jgi:transcription antitermination factor NusG